MLHTLSPDRLIVLPRLDAAGTLALARAVLDTAAEQRAVLKASGLTTVSEALQEIEEDATALETTLTNLRLATTHVGVYEADKREDLAVGVLHDVLLVWARLAKSLESARIAERLYERLFGSEGIAVVNLPFDEEWAAVDAKLGVIAHEHLEPELEALGLTPLVAHLRGVHEEYGRAIGSVVRTSSGELFPVRARREALLASIRLYVLRVVASVDRRHPESGTLADALLRPVVEARRHADEAA